MADSADEMVVVVDVDMLYVLDIDIAGAEIYVPLLAIEVCWSASDASDQPTLSSK